MGAANLTGLGSSIQHMTNGAPVPRARGRRVPLEAAGELGAQAGPGAPNMDPIDGLRVGMFTTRAGFPRDSRDGRHKAREQDRALDQPELPGQWEPVRSGQVRLT